MRKRPVLIVLIVALLFVLSIAGTALAAKVVPTITDADLTFKSVEGVNTYYYYSITFTGRPYQYTYTETHEGPTSYLNPTTIDRVDLKDGTINSTLGFNTAAAGPLVSVTFYLYDRKGNQIGSSYTVPAP